MSDAIGLLEVEGVGGIIVGADAACKAANVSLMGWESIGGFTTVFLRGPVSDVGRALQAAAGAARTVNAHAVTAALHQPQPEAVRFIGFPLEQGDDDEASDNDLALGLVETRGYGVHVDLDDRMVKAADVRVAKVLTVHNRVVCSLVTGPVDAVQQAVDTGRRLLADSEWFMGSAVIPQPVPEVLRAFAGARPADGAS